MADRQTHVFIESTEPDGDWVDTLLGRVIRPLVHDHESELDWFWFTHYGTLGSDPGDCDLSKIPESCKRPLHPQGSPFTRSLRFRFGLADTAVSTFEDAATRLLAKHPYSISDFRAYDHVKDLGSARFLGEPQGAADAERRAALMVQFLHAASRLTLDTLRGPFEGERYRAEKNEDQLQNPRGSTFQSVLHLFCNTTRVPTEVWVFHKAAMHLMGYGTFIYPPQQPPGGWDGYSSYAIRF